MPGDLLQLRWLTVKKAPGLQLPAGRAVRSDRGASETLHRAARGEDRDEVDDGWTAVGAKCDRGYI